MDPQISIIIPLFNEAQVIHSTLNSILDQTFKDFEIIYIDDASLDSSVKILENYQKKDKRIKIICTNGEGFAHAQNLALEYALGKYIIFFRNGNLMSSNLLEYLVKIITEYNATIALCDYFNVEERDFHNYSINPPNQKKEILTELDSTKYLKKLTSKNNHTFESTCILFNKLIDKSILTGFSFDFNKFHCNQFAIWDLFNQPQKIISSNQILIAHTTVDDYFKRTCFSYHDHEEIEFMQKVFTYIKKTNKNSTFLKYTAIRLTILLYNIRLKLTNPYLDIFDLKEQRKKIDQQFISIRKFLKTQYPDDENNEEDYTFYFKRYKKLLSDEKFRENYPALFVLPPKRFDPLGTDKNGYTLK